MLVSGLGPLRVCGLVHMGPCDTWGNVGLQPSYACSRSV